MPPPKAVLVARFEVPPESMPGGGPVHKIQHGFTADGVRCHAVFRRMGPLRTHAQHELGFFRERPRLLKQKVGVPFCRVRGEKRRNSRLKFQPVLYRRNFNRDGGAEAPSAVCEIPARSSSKLDDSGRLLIDRLRESVSRAEQRYDQYRFCRVHSMCSYPSSHSLILGCKVLNLLNSNRPTTCFSFTSDSSGPRKDPFGRLLSGRLRWEPAEP